jgi:hypothetical protein
MFRSTLGPFGARTLRQAASKATLINSTAPHQHVLRRSIQTSSKARPTTQSQLNSAAFQRRFISFSLDRLPFPLAFTIRLTLSAIIGLGAIGGVILIHDALTYQERHVDRVPTNALALHPRRGGPKNLPIVEIDLSDEEDDIKKALSSKPKLVIVGGGWGVSISWKDATR